MADGADLLAALLPARSRALVGVDFDGTLAPIVDDPAAARPLDGAPDVLAALAGVCAEVAVVSGRPLAFLVPHLPEAVTVVGLYGLETRRHGVATEHPDAPRWRAVVDRAAVQLRRAVPSGARVEHKGLSITLHHREHPELADDLDALAETVGAAEGLEVRPARMSVELHPPLATDKGTVLATLAADHDGPVLFLGDDLGDLPAFDALDALAAAGRPVLRVAVDSGEVPAALVDRADVVVHGPGGAADLLRRLAAD